MSRYTLRQLGLGIKRAQVRHHRTLDARLSAIGISLVQWDALRHLSLNPEASLHELAQLTFQSDQAFGTLATRMASRRLIDRVEGPGRAVRHTITPTGRRLLKRGDAIADEAFGDSFAPLSSAQRQQLGHLLDLLNGADAPPRA